MEMVNCFFGFDGIRVSSQSLKECGVNTGFVYSSEIDADANDVGRKHHPSCVELGDIRHVNALDLDFIDLYGGGSPCQNFCFQSKKDGMITDDGIIIDTLDKYLELKKAGFEFKGQSYLFWEWFRGLQEAKSVNPDISFFLENVKMDKKWRDVISVALGVEPVLLNSVDTSAMSRPRYIWANFDIKPIVRERDYALSDVIVGDMPDHVMMSDYQYKRLIPAGNSDGECRPLFHKNGRRTGYQVFDINAKVECLTTSQGGGRTPSIPWKGGARNLHPIEYERCFNLPDNYTQFGLSGKKMAHGPRKKMLGNSWDVKMIRHVIRCWMNARLI